MSVLASVVLVSVVCVSVVLVSVVLCHDVGADAHFVCCAKHSSEEASDPHNTDKMAIVAR